MCAIVGVFDVKHASKIAYYALFAMQHRGQEATGISASNGKKIRTIKDNGLVTEVFNEEKLSFLNGDMAIGHNRYSTAGSDSVRDAQPVAASYKLGDISVVHNGNLINKHEVRSKLIEQGAIFQSSMDTENIIHLIARSQQGKLQDRIIEALHVIKGAYCLLIQSRTKMFAVRDRYGVRPLSIGRLKEGGFIVASETCALDLVDAEFVRDVRPGEMIIFHQGETEFESIQLFEPDPHICAFEFIYFARPDSVIEGKNVYATRKKMGMKLAELAPVEADFVVPVPDSGVSAALGYAQASGIPFEMAIVRNHYVGRTFIEPTQAVRDLKVKLKLSPIHKILEGKKIVVIDDSIVRGTTSRQIVKLLKRAGAAEVHMRIAAPTIEHPCLYGIDTPSYKELISANKSVEEVREYIEADSLAFLSVDALKESIGNDMNYSLVSFDGNYFIK
ncbi:amidophosphoribosyltransferase [Sulfurospirillum barnesii]|uniref:Amidophosphoribosyltransferase n=1 Tax=Sulfurospirillum barnesii (strain ATCC 700032 / DSM 10660 / SES-3) TaxID=760154 RepID=I3XU95_SULBS|nr:amidophosphoribosyltransferase [Sulfurospirillum barnesii]AFL67519.1 amidophosphoribosyltransferase [Sulfurospirillum barnesii SES-3]